MTILSAFVPPVTSLARAGRLELARAGAPCLLVACVLTGAISAAWGQGPPPPPPKPAAAAPHPSDTPPRRPPPPKVATPAAPTKAADPAVATGTGVAPAGTGTATAGTGNTGTAATAPAGTATAATGPTAGTAAPTTGGTATTATPAATTAAAPTASTATAAAPAAAGATAATATPAADAPVAAGAPPAAAAAPATAAPAATGTAQTAAATAKAEEAADEPEEELKAPTVKDMVPPPNPTAVGPFSRRVLAIYDSNEAKLELTPIFEDAEVVFDHLGMMLDYCDIRTQPLPSHAEMAKYRGIFTWFSDPRLPDPGSYLKWLTEEGKQGRYVVMLGSLGAYVSAAGQVVPNAQVVKPFGSWGFTYKPHDLVPSVLLKATYVDPKSFPNGGFEHKLRVSPGNVDTIKPLEGADVQPLLKVECEELPGSESHLAAIHPYGGFALGEYLIYADPATYNRQWSIDPFYFLQRCYRIEDTPRVDLTTLNGLRMFYAHVDGDGALNLCEWGTRRLTPVESYNFFRDAKLPITLSVVEGEVIEAAWIPWVRSTSVIKDAFKRLFALPNIMPASHACTHPFSWEGEITAIHLPGISRPPQSPAEIEHVKKSEYPTSFVFEVRDRSAWEKRELLDSCAFVSTLTPKDKPCDLFLWTGDCRPPASAIKLLTEHGIANLNGGDGQFDNLSPSYSGLAPAVRHVGDQIQIHSSNANENIYTNGWTGNYSGFYNVVQTFANTAKPRRIKPINIYFHYYLFEKLGSYEAVKRVFKYCEGQLETDGLAPVFTRDFSRWVSNSREITLSREGDGWSWENATVCRTLRFDHPTRVPDLVHSQGVLGYSTERELDCMYVHLDGKGAGRLVWLPEGVTAPRGVPYLERATGWVDAWQVNGDAVSLKFTANGRAFVELAGLPANTPCRCESTGAGAAGSQTQRSDANGRLRLVFDGPEYVKNFTLTVRPAAAPEAH